VDEGLILMRKHIFTYKDMSEGQNQELMVVDTARGRSGSRQLAWLSSSPCRVHRVMLISLLREKHRTCEYWASFEGKRDRHNQRGCVSIPPFAATAPRTRAGSLLCRDDAGGVGLVDLKLNFLYAQK